MRLLALVILALTAGVAADKPNIILIMADDVGWEAFGCYGADDYQTPNLDQLAVDGVRFEHCYSTPLCTTSRVTIMSGQYNFRNYTHFGYMDPSIKTIGNLLQDAGYATAIAGKWQLNGIYNPDVFADHADTNRANKAGFDEYCLWQYTQGKQAGERFWHAPLEINGRVHSKQENNDRYGPDLIRDFVFDFIERHQDQPFFVYYPMVLVHDPFVATPDTIGDGPRSNKEPKSAVEKKRHFVAMVAYMDKIVGQLVAKLDELGERDNTLILFTSDNGTHRKVVSSWNGRDIQGGKGAMTDMGTHVPLIASWPGRALSGEVTGDLVDFTDFYPTLAAAAGIQLDDSDPQDGQSFLPQILGQPTTPRQWVLCHYQPFWGPPGKFTTGIYARNQRHKLYHDQRLYDMSDELDEATPITIDQASEDYHLLNQVLQQCPPARTGSRDTPSEERQAHPDWPTLQRH
ncbi:MAG: sulfatase-like hydrolase/transferase [Planctomycetota bacterium]|jgi:arylsulfatase A-like enzyme